MIIDLTGPPDGYSSAMARALNWVAASAIIGWITIDRPRVARSSSLSSRPPSGSRVFNPCLYLCSHSDLASLSFSKKPISSCAFRPSSRSSMVSARFWSNSAPSSSSIMSNSGSPIRTSPSGSVSTIRSSGGAPSANGIMFSGSAIERHPFRFYKIVIIWVFTMPNKPSFAEP